MLPQAKFGLPTDTYKILIKNPVGTSHFSQCWGTSDWLCWMLASFRALVLPSFDPNWVGLLAESQVQPNLQKVRARVQSCQMTSLQITKESQRSETILMLWGHLVILGRASLRPFQLQLHQRLYFVSLCGELLVPLCAITSISLVSFPPTLLGETGMKERVE